MTRCLFRGSLVHPNSIFLFHLKKNGYAKRVYYNGGPLLHSHVRHFANPSNVNEKTSTSSFKQSDIIKPTSSFKRYFYSGILMVSLSLGSLVYFASQDSKLNDQLKLYVPFFPWEILQPSSNASSPSSSDASTTTSTSNAFITTFHSWMGQLKEIDPFVFLKNLPFQESSSSSSSNTDPSSLSKSVEITTSVPISSSSSSSSSPSSSLIKKPNAETPTLSDSTLTPPTLSSKSTVHPSPSPSSLSSSSSTITIDSISSPSSSATSSSKSNDPTFLTFVGPFEKNVEELTALLDSLGQSIPHIQPSMKKLRDLVNQLHDRLQLILSDTHTIQSNHSKILENKLTVQKDTFEKELQLALANALEVCEKEQHQLRLQSTNDLKQQTLNHQLELEQQKEKWELETQQKLNDQALKLTQTWEKEVQKKLDLERNGRLAQLDQLSLKLKHLDQAFHSIFKSNHSFTQLHAFHLLLQHLSHSMVETKPGFQQDWIRLSQFDFLDPSFFNLIFNSISFHHITHFTPFQELHSSFINDLVPQLRPLACVKDPYQVGFFSYTLAKLCNMLLLAPFSSSLPFLTSSSSSSSFSFFSSTTTQNKEPKPNPSILSILQRADEALQNQDLDTATRMINQLQGWPKRLAQDWLIKARSHLEVKLALEALQAQAETLMLKSCLI